MQVTIKWACNRVDSIEMVCPSLGLKDLSDVVAITVIRNSGSHVDYSIPR